MNMGFAGGVIALIGVALALLAAAPAGQDAALPDAAPAVSASVRIGDDSVVQPPGLPELGKWLLDSNGVAADWLGEVYQGKSLREPITVVIVDEAAGSPEQAVSRLLAATAAAGYEVRRGHSCGYQAYIGGALHAQLPGGRDHAFSDDPFEISNNHGRIFGPSEVGDSYVFTAAFSREEVDPFTAPRHRFGAFNRARDDFTQRLDRTSTFKVAGFVGMANAIVGDPALTTVEHDGVAVLLRAKQ